MRRVLAAAPGAAALTVVGLLLAPPAGAAVPEGFSDPDPVDVIPALLLLGGIPLVLFVLIGLAVYVPAMARGERVAPGVAPINDQWLGGPREGTRRLAGPDGADSVAGGAHARW